ncbi:MAG: hypothetical protein GOU98_03780 [Candidatus Altiarchaeota archaeon]|nr:hypothetical protein [Candidatus Altiarchaeota archaeon]
MDILVDTEELTKIEKEFGVLKKLEAEKIKWLLPPDWNEKQFSGVYVEVSDELAPKIFEKYNVKTLRKK